MNISPNNLWFAWLSAALRLSVVVAIVASVAPGQETPSEAPEAKPAAEEAPAVGADRAERVAATRELVKQWADTNRQISAERRQWRENKAFLEERIRMAESEIARLRDLISKTEETVKESSEEFRELESERDDLKKASERLTTLIGDYERRVMTLKDKLPKHVREHIQPFLQRVPKDAAETKQSLGERFQNVVGVVNALTKFNREIKITNELHQIDAETSVEAPTMYIGLGHAYFATADLEYAGIGTISEGKWTWIRADGDAEKIKLAIDIANNDGIAQFVRLPIRIQ